MVAPIGKRARPRSERHKEGYREPTAAEKAGAAGSPDLMAGRLIIYDLHAYAVMLAWAQRPGAGERFRTYLETRHVDLGAR